jgi:hypothetical protein
MSALEIVKRRQHEIEMENAAVLRISASASFLNALVEECKDVERVGYDFTFAGGLVVRLDSRLPFACFMIELGS